MNSSTLCSMVPEAAISLMTKSHWKFLGKSDSFSALTSLLCKTLDTHNDFFLLATIVVLSYSTFFSYGPSLLTLFSIVPFFYLQFKLLFFQSFFLHLQFSWHYIFPWAFLSMDMCLIFRPPPPGRISPLRTKIFIQLSMGALIPQEIQTQHAQSLPLKNSYFPTFINTITIHPLSKIETVIFGFYIHSTQFQILWILTLQYLSVNTFSYIIST